MDCARGGRFAPLRAPIASNQVEKGAGLVSLLTERYSWKIQLRSTQIQRLGETMATTTTSPAPAQETEKKAPLQPDPSGHCQGARDHGHPGSDSRGTAHRRGGRRLLRVPVLHGLREPERHDGQGLQIRRLAGICGRHFADVPERLHSRLRGDAGSGRLQV
jgi:hypothetical protein